MRVDKQILYHTIFLVVFAISVGMLLRDHTGMAVGKISPRPLTGEASAYVGVNHMTSAADTPFLQGGATHTIWWFGWQREAFAVARLLNRPIMLYIGAGWSELARHLDHAVFTNRELADLINERVIPIRVDQDARPDIDARYRLAARAIGGGSQDSVIVFLTPSGEVFFAADALDNPAEAWRELPTIIDSVSEYYRGNPTVVESNAAALRSQLKAYFIADWADASPPARDVVEKYLQSSIARFDGVQGGFVDQAGKWPDIGTLHLYLRVARSWPNQEQARERAVLTLDRMANSGLCDQIGGGFHRGTVDPAWQIPYFGKTLEANAKMLRLYTDAYSATRDPRYRAVALATTDFLLQRLRDEHSGLFYAAELSTPQNATWTKQELAQRLPAAEEQVAMLSWGIEQEPRTLAELPRGNIIVRRRTFADVAQRLGWSEEKVEQTYTQAVAHLRTSMYETRDIAFDHTYYASGNGAAIAALFRAGEMLDHPAALQAAEQALTVLMERGVDGGRGLRHRLDRAGEYFLQDQAALLEALLAAYQATHDIHWRTQAEKVAAFIDQRFGAPLLAGLYDQYPEELANPPLGLVSDPLRPFFDLIGDPTNGRLALAYLQLYYLTGNDDWRIIADGIFGSFAELLRQPMNRSVATLVYALLYQLDPPTQVMIVGEPDDAATQKLFTAAHLGGGFDTLWQRSNSAEPDWKLPKTITAALQSLAPPTAPTALVCKRRHCSAALTTPEAVLTALRGR